MKKMRSVFRFRFAVNVLALVFALGALYASPTAGNVPPRECEGGCIGWDAANGCTTYQVCCVYEGGSYQCWRF